MEGKQLGWQWKGCTFGQNTTDKTQIHPFALMKSFLPGSNTSPLKHLAGILPLPLCWDNGQLNDSFVLGWERVIRRGKSASFGSSTSRSLDSCLGFLSDLEQEKEMSSEKSECDDLLGRQSEAEQPAGRGSVLAFPDVLAEGFREQPGELLGQAPGWLQAGSILHGFKPQISHLWHLITHLAPSI